jgi:hypothetical protein
VGVINGAVRAFHFYAIRAYWTIEQTFALRILDIAHGATGRQIPTKYAHFSSASCCAGIG